MGKLNKDEPREPYLIILKVLERTDYSIVACFVNGSVSVVARRMYEDKLCVLCSDASASLLNVASMLVF
jgi:hypothetical protein